MVTMADNAISDSSMFYCLILLKLSTGLFSSGMGPVLLSLCSAFFLPCLFITSGEIKLQVQTGRVCVCVCVRVCVCVYVGGGGSSL